jgi:deazaflavin-dependent oxidoreductase (nitroreductase family)
MRRFVGVLLLVLGGSLVAAFMAWRRDRRLGSAFVNRVVDPVLVERGLSGRGASEIGTVEHIGRRSGTRRLTPVHPVPTADGMRIVVPLAERSEWARNVLAAGRCRIELHGMIHDLDQPVLARPADVPGLPGPVRLVGTALDTRYLLLHEVRQEPGSLVAV